MCVCVFVILHIRDRNSPVNSEHISLSRRRDFAARPGRLFSIRSFQWQPSSDSTIRKFGKRLICFAHFRNILSVTFELSPFVASFAAALFNSGASACLSFSISLSLFLVFFLSRFATTFSAVPHGISWGANILILFRVSPAYIQARWRCTNFCAIHLYTVPFVRSRAEKFGFPCL